MISKYTQSELFCLQQTLCGPGSQLKTTNQPINMFWTLLASGTYKE